MVCQHKKGKRKKYVDNSQESLLKIWLALIIIFLKYINLIRDFGINKKYLKGK